MSPAHTAFFTGPRVAEGRSLPCGHKAALRRAAVRHCALAKTATLARTASSSGSQEQSSPAGKAWLPWTRPDQPAQAEQAAPGPSGRPQTSQQPEPVKSKTGTQLILPWLKPTSAEASTSSTGSPSVPYWRLPGTSQKAITGQAAPARPLSPPIVSCAGGG